MIACGATHPQNPNLRCVEWSEHMEPHHLSYSGSHIPQNEVRWPDAYSLTLRPRCKRCSYRYGHRDYCDKEGLNAGYTYWTYDAMEEAELL